MIEALEGVNDIPRVETRGQLGVDRVTYWGPHFVRALTDKFIIGSKGVITRRVARTGYLYDGYNREDTQPRSRDVRFNGPISVPMPESGAVIEGMIDNKLVLGEPHSATIRDLIPPSILDRLPR
jgi:hypothetical protein